MSGGFDRRLLVAAVVVAASVSTGGCLTLDPGVEADVADSAVFESVAVEESWAGTHVRATVTLASTPEAKNVTRISVVAASGVPFDAVDLEPGQERVVLELPANANATLVATDTVNGTTVETLNVTTTGREVF